MFHGIMYGARRGLADDTTSVRFGCISLLFGEARFTVFDSPLETDLWSVKCHLDLWKVGSDGTLKSSLRPRRRGYRPFGREFLTFLMAFVLIVTRVTGFGSSFTIVRVPSDGLKRFRFRHPISTALHEGLEMEGSKMGDVNDVVPLAIGIIKLHSVISRTDRFDNRSQGVPEPIEFFTNMFFDTDSISRREFSERSVSIGGLQSLQLLFSGKFVHLSPVFS